MVSLEVTVPSDLSNELYQALGAAIQGDVYLRNDPNYHDYTKMFNGNVQTFAKAVTCPLNAEDVSRIIIFCLKNGLSPSVKAGGYGTAGWAIGGDIIIDLSRINEADIELPREGGTYTSLRDMAPAGSKGKSKVGVLVADESAPNCGKRRREDDALLRKYSAASPAVARFLSGLALPSDSSERPRPAARRKISLAPASDRAAREISIESKSTNSSFASGTGSDACRNKSSPSTGVSSPSPPAGGSGQEAAPPSRADPFGYMTSAPNPPPQSSTSASHPPYTLAGSFSPSPFSGGLSMTDPFGYMGSGPSMAPPLRHGFLPLQSIAAPWATMDSAFPNPSLPSASHGLLTHAEPLHPHAYVTFGAGMRQKEIDQFTAEKPIQARSLSGSFGLIPYHVPFSAHPVGSSIMLLGGFGFLGRLHGLSIDNLVEVEMVLADGRIVIVNEKEHPDLWWALRGAGPAFGVATRYKARAYPVPVVYAGNLVYRFHRATAPSLIKHFRDCVKSAPRELYANVLLTAGPEDKDSLVVIQMCYVGPKEKGQEYLAAISSWDGERCLLNEVDEKTFLHQQDSVAQVLRGQAGRQWFIRSALITSLPDDVVNQTVLQFADTPIGCTWLFELAGGAIADFEDSALPKAQREASFTVAALHQWEMGTDDPRCVASAEEWIAGTLKPVSTGGPYPSFLGRHESAERKISCYGDNWARLCEIKKMHDPTCLFKNCFWPLDAAGEPMEPEMYEPPTPADV